MCSTVTKCIPRDMVIKNVAPFTNITSTMRVTNFYNFKSFRYSNVIHHNPIRVLSQCLAPGIRKFWTKHGVSISDFRGSNKVVFYRVVACHRFKVSLIWMTNHSMGFAREFGRRYLFLSGPLKIFPGGLYKCRVVGFFVVNLW